jgi:hypothetical protein
MAASPLDPACRAKRAEATGGIDTGARPEIDTSGHHSLLWRLIVERDDICGPILDELGRGAKRGNRQSPGLSGLAARCMLRALL